MHVYPLPVNAPAADAVLERLRQRWHRLPPAQRPGPNWIAELLAESEINALRRAGRWPVRGADLEHVLVRKWTVRPVGSFTFWYEPEG
jgi:hypothetical protein